MGVVSRGVMTDFHVNLKVVGKYLVLAGCHHVVHLSNYKVKYWLLIGGIRLMRNFMDDCAN